MMGYRTLYIWVEGDDDVRFFEQVIKPRFDARYDWVEVRPYRSETKDWLKRFFRTIRKMNDDYIFVADLDSAPCVTARKEQIIRDYNYLDKDSIAIVGREIESWYLAGLDETSCKQLGLSRPRATDTITKEQFETLMPRKYDSRRDFMLEILKCFSVPVAKGKNDSFRYFADKHEC